MKRRIEELEIANQALEEEKTYFKNQLIATRERLENAQEEYKDACDAALIQKDKVAKGLEDQIQILQIKMEHILTLVEQGKSLDSLKEEVSKTATKMFAEPKR